MTRSFVGCDLSCHLCQGVTRFPCRLFRLSGLLYATIVTTNVLQCRFLRCVFAQLSACGSQWYNYNRYYTCASAVVFRGSLSTVRSWISMVTTMDTIRKCQILWGSVMFSDGFSYFSVSFCFGVTYFVWFVPHTMSTRPGLDFPSRVLDLPLS
jgi:hypothetical protein